MKITQNLSAVLGSRLPYPALLMGIGVALTAESIIVTAASARHPVAWLLGVGLGIMVLGVLLANQWWRPHSWKLDRLTGEQAAPARWLVVTASLGRGRASAVEAARYHFKYGGRKLERVVVLYTNDDRGRQARHALSQDLEELGLSEEGVEITPVSLASAATEDPEIVYRKLEGIYRQAAERGVEEDDVVLDYTGGTVAFTAAMVLTGAIERRRLQNVRPCDIDEDGRPVPGEGLHVIEVDLRYKVAPSKRWK